MKINVACLAVGMILPCSIAESDGTFDSHTMPRPQVIVAVVVLKSKGGKSKSSKYQGVGDE